MTLEYIAESLEEKHRDWALANLTELDRVAQHPIVAKRIVKFIEEAVRHPTSRTGDPKTSFANSIRMAALANFRLGLLLGILIDRQEAEVKVNCPNCSGSGEVCLKCGFSKQECSCEARSDYSPVKCEVCQGKGDL